MSALSDQSLNILVLTVLLGSLLLLFKYMKQYQDRKRLFTIRSAKQLKEIAGRSKSLYRGALKQQLTLLFTYRGNPSYAPIAYLVIYTVEASIFIVVAFAGKLFYAIFLTFLLHAFVLKLIKLLTINIHDIIEREFPKTLKHFTKVMAKTNDLKTVIYETSKDVDEPIRSLMLELYRKMISGNQEEALMEFAEEVDNPWVYAFVFLLLNYKEQAKKEDIEENMLVLARMLEKEREVKEKAITDKKFIVAINYAIALFALVAFVGNFLINPSALEFFFEASLGFLALAIGIALFLLTIIINVKMSK